MAESIAEILDFWFGELDSQGLPSASRQSLWFKQSDATDSLCRERFANLVASAIDGELNHWAEQDNGLLALILLLDQMTRNIYRATPLAFAGDARALGLARAAIADNRHRELPGIYQVFLYLPLEHSEDSAMQQESVDLFSALAGAQQHDLFSNYLRYAQAHRDVIVEFGRFPHRNAILGRASSDREIAYLATHGGF